MSRVVTYDTAHKIHESILLGIDEGIHSRNLELKRCFQGYFLSFEIHVEQYLRRGFHADVTDAELDY